MSQGLRLSIILVMLLATVALGMIAYNANATKPAVAQAAAIPQDGPAPAMSAYFVAAHSLPAGTLARDDDFAIRTSPPAEVPQGAILDSADARIELRGSMVRKFLDTGHPITSQDVLRPRDRGFLASVLAPDTRAISINVDAESGVSGLIWPGDYVDVILTQISDKADPVHRSLSEILLHKVRVIAIDQEIVQGTSGANAAAGRIAHSVSLQLSPEQVKKVALAKDIGKLSLAIRAAVEHTAAVDGGTMFGCEVSPEIARLGAIASQSTTIAIYQNGKSREYTVKKQATGRETAASGCGGAVVIDRQSNAVARLSGEQGQD